MISSDTNSSQSDSRKDVQSDSNKPKKHHPLLRPFIAFWEFSSYYADYKARIWDMK